MEKMSGLLLLLLLLLTVSLSGEVVLSNVVDDRCKAPIATDNDLLEFQMNLDYLLCDFLLCSATGKSSDEFNPSLAAGGPPPFGCQRANLDPPYRRIVEEMGFEMMGNLKATAKASKGRVIPRPLLNLSSAAIARYINKAFEMPLHPPFDAYAGPRQFSIVAQGTIYIASLVLNGATPMILDRELRSISAKLQSMRAGQTAIFRGRLYSMANEIVVPYGITVAEFMNKTAVLANRLAKCGIKDEGIIVPRSLGAENLTEANVLAADVNSLPYTRTPQEALSIMYATGDQGVPGGAFPKGANGRLAERFIKSRND